MKKLFALIATAALLFPGSTPAHADVSYFDDWPWWGDLTRTSAASISYTGSLVAGQNYQVTASGTVPGNNECVVIIQNLGGGPFVYSTSHRGNFSVSSGDLVAGSAGTYEQFGLQIFCSQAANYHGQFMKLTFEAPVAAPQNLNVIPQAGGVAFTSWGTSARATSYTVTAIAVNSSLNLPVRYCTTSQNFCDVTGLNSEAAYNFSVVGTDGSFTSSAATSGPISMSPPVSVAAAITSNDWRAGSSTSVLIQMQGTPSPTASITWYRCSTPASSTNAQPAGCDLISTGVSTSYTMGAADVGKYIAAYVLASNGSSSSGQTSASSTAVLAANAVAPTPTADPAGKPTIVNIPNPIVSVSGGNQVTITGTGLSGVIAVTVGGLPATVVSKSETTLVIQVPISTKVGLADLIISNAQGSVTSGSAIVYTTNPVIKITKTKNITGFTASSKTLTAAQKSVVKALLTANPTLTELTCAAKTTGVKATKTELAKAATLAKAACAYAKSLKSTLVAKTSAAQTLPKAKTSRTVLLTLKN